MLYIKKKIFKINVRCVIWVIFAYYIYIFLITLYIWFPPLKVLAGYFQKLQQFDAE